MDKNKRLERKDIKIFNQDKGSVIAHALLLIFILSMVLLEHAQYFVFHISVEIFTIVIGSSILIIATCTYKISKNDFFIILGLGYALVGVLDVIHSLSYSSMNIIPNASLDLVKELGILARLLELATMLIASLFINKRVGRMNYLLIFSVFFGIFLFSILNTVKSDVVSILFIQEIGTLMGKFAAIIEYIIAAGFFTCIFILNKSRKCMDRHLYLYLVLSIVIKLVCEVLFAVHGSPGSLIALFSHILKIISFYFLYMAIIVSSLQRPFETLVFNLDLIDNDFKEKEKQRKHMEEAIEKNEKCYEMIVNNSSDGIIIKKGGAFIYANSTAAKILGFKDSSELLGKDKFEFLIGNSFSAFGNNKKTITQTNPVLPLSEFTIRRSDGEIIYVELSASYVLYRGEASTLIMFRDVSYRKKIQVLESDIREKEDRIDQSKEYNRMQMQFFSNISHELKTPLNVILGTIQLLSLPVNDKLSYCSNSMNFKRYIWGMRQNCYRLIRIVNNIIDISKIDSKYMKLNLKNYNIVSIVEDISLSIVDYAKSRGIELIFDTNVEEKNMAIDADQIERIVLNLLSNAIKFTNKGDAITVTVKDKGETAIISVKDTGIGIPKDKINLIFDRFGQVDKSLTRNREGSGIGLALVKNLVEMHGGNIKVHSKLGKGSEFIIELPVKNVEGEATANLRMCQSNIEKIKIEFSDIYAI